MFIRVIGARLLTIRIGVVVVATLVAVLHELLVPLVLLGLRGVVAVTNLVAGLATKVALAGERLLRNLRTVGTGPVGVVVVVVVVVARMVGRALVVVARDVMLDGTSITRVVTLVVSWRTVGLRVLACILALEGCVHPRDVVSER